MLSKKLLLYSIIILVGVTYLYPYTVDTIQIIIGFPFEWLTIYDLSKSKFFYQSTHINIIHLMVNISIYYFMCYIVQMILKLVRDKYFKDKFHSKGSSIENNKKGDS